QFNRPTEHLERTARSHGHVISTRIGGSAAGGGRILAGGARPLRPGRRRRPRARRHPHRRRPSGARAPPTHAAPRLTRRSLRTRVSATEQLTDATLTQSRAKKTNSTVLRIKALSPSRVVEVYSAGIKLALVARGEADLYVNTYRAFHDWDICAGHILVEEAG